jgi:periplasmic divalent cation tolerance protein
MIEISWTCGSIDEARRVSRFLVQERYAACAQITPWIESIYMWNNQMETAQETKVIFKTQRDNLEKVIEVIKKNSRYEIPEILWKETEGVEDYLKWVQESSKLS